MSMETAVAATAILAESMAREAEGTPEGAEIIGKAKQLLAAGAHAELTFRFAGELIDAELAIRTDTGDLLRVGTKRMVKRHHGNC